MRFSSLLILLLISSSLAAGVNIKQELEECRKTGVTRCYCDLARDTNDSSICNAITEEYGRLDCINWMQGNVIIDGPCWGSNAAICEVLDNIKTLLRYFFVLVGIGFFILQLILLKRKKKLNSRQIGKWAGISLAFVILSILVVEVLFYVTFSGPC